MRVCKGILSICKVDLLSTQLACSRTFIKRLEERFFRNAIMKGF